MTVNTPSRRKALGRACAPVVEQLEGRAYFSIPTAPASLAASAASISQINLSWADQSTDETGFKIERSTNGGSSYSQIGTVGSNVTTFNNTALASQTTYTYRVRAYNADGNSAYTSAASDTTAGPPAAPSNLSATPVSVNQINLSWTNNDSGVSAATSYKVERSTDGGSTFTQIAGSLTPGTSTYAVGGLTAGTTYVFRVRASNGVNSNSAYSNTATATTVSAPAAPSNLIAMTLSTSQIKLDWTRNDSGASAATSFKVEKSSDGGATWGQVASLGGTAVTYTATSLTAGVTYSFRVRASNGAFSDYSNMASALTIDAPAAPSNLAATVVSPVQVNLSWTRNDTTPAATSYKIEASTDGGSTYTQIYSAPSSWSTFSATGLNPATAYIFRVRAYNGAYSAYSNTASATTPAIPTAPANLTATAASTTQIDLSWTPTDGGIATSYVLEKSLNGGSTYSTLATLSPGTSSYSYTGASPLTAYTFRVRAYNGVYSPSSNVVTITPGSFMAAPSAVTAKVVSSSQVDLKWSDNSTDETGFVVQKKVGNGAWTDVATLSSNSTSYSVTGLSNGSTASYRVAAVNGSVQSLTSNVASATAGQVDPGEGVYVVTLGSLEIDPGSGLQNVEDNLVLIDNGLVTAEGLQDAIAKAIEGNALVHATSGQPYNDGQDRTFTWDFNGGTSTSDYSAAFRLSALTADSSGVFTGTIYLEDTYGWSSSDYDYNDDSWEVTVTPVLPAVVSVEVGVSPAKEPGTVPGTFVFHRDGDLSRELEITYTLGGTAENLSDYKLYVSTPNGLINAAPGSITFAPNQPSATLVVIPLRDVDVEPNQFVRISIDTGGPLYIPAVQDPAELTIIDQPTVQILPGDHPGAEFGPLSTSFTFTRQGDDSEDLHVLFTLTGTADYGLDYTIDGALGNQNPPSYFVVDIKAHTMATTVTINPLLDSIVEPTETVVATLLSPVPSDGYGIDIDTVQSVDILDNAILNDQQPQTSGQVSAATHQRVDIHGVPLPDPSPTGEGESDRIPNMANVDAFSLSPSFSTTDFAVSMPGDELAMEFRRTLSMDSEVKHSSLLLGVTPFDIDHHWGAEEILGQGWDTNIGSHILVNYSPNHPSDMAAFTATVVDEVGNDVVYSSNNGTDYSADIRLSFSDAALRGRLTRNGSGFIYAKTFGTQLYFDFVGYAPDSSGLFHLNADTEAYYRISRVIDRNGNEMDFAYDGPENTLVTAVYDPSLGTATTSPRKIQFSYSEIGSKWRLIQAIDPLGHAYDYHYDGIGLLTSVEKPAVADPGNPETTVRPEVHFTYEQTGVSTSLRYETTPLDFGLHLANPFSTAAVTTWTLPSTITDAEGNVTSFTYDFRYTPNAIKEKLGQAAIIWDYKPRITSVTTADGTATFNEILRSSIHAVTSATDTRGVTTTFNFGTGDVATQIIPASNNLGFAIVIDQFSRSVDVADVDGNVQTKTVTYKYSGKIDNNLVEVTDMSGNVIRYEYDSGDANDPFNAKPFGDYYGTYYQIYNKPSRSIQAAGELDLTKSYRYDTTYNKLIKEVDASGTVTTYTLDAQGNRLSVTEAAGTSVAATSSNTYDSRGFVTSTVDADGRTTEYVANAYGNLAYTIVKGYSGEDLTPLESTSPYAAVDPNAHYLVTYRDADVMDRTLSTEDGRGNVTTYQYDNWNRLVATVLPAVLVPTWDPILGGSPVLLASTSRKAYDFNSNVVEDIDDNGNATLYAYDALNRTISTRRRMDDPNADSADDIVMSWAYDAVGLLKDETNANGRVTHHDYDAILRSIKTVLPTVTVTTDPTSTSANPATTTQTYVQKMYYGPNAGSGAFTLGGFNPTRVIDTRGIAMDSVFDDAYRLIRSVHRTDGGSGVASTAAARAGETETDTFYDPSNHVVKTTTLNEDRSGASTNLQSFNFYDARHRATVTVTDMDGDGAGVAAGTVVNDASSFSGDSDDLIGRSQYDAAGNVRFVTDALGRTTESRYDGASRKTEVLLPAVDVYQHPGGLLTGQTLTTSTIYDGNSNAVRAVDARGVQSESRFDARNRVISTVLDLNGDGTFDTTVGPSSADIVHLTGYDLNGNTVYSIDANGNRTDTQYDAANRAVLIQAPAVADAENGNALNRPTVQTIYDHQGNVVTTIDPRGIETDTQYDEWNRPRFVTVNSTADVNARDRVTTETRYDANGNKLAVVLYNRQDGVTKPQVTTYVYDALNRQTSETLPAVDGSTRQTLTFYDRVGQALTVVDAKGQATESDYDRAGRVVEQRFKDGGGSVEETRDSVYDKAGNLLSRSDLNGVSTYVYDALNRVTEEGRSNTTTGLTDSYVVISAYDAGGNRTRVVYPDTSRTLISEFDRAGRMTAMLDGASVTGFVYDSAGNRTHETQANGTTENRVFDAGNRVVSMTNQTSGGDEVYYISYKYDLAGNRRFAGERVSGQSERHLTWDYDGLYRLTEEQWTGPAAQTRTYQYDKAGNRTYQGILSGVSLTETFYDYDRLNQLNASSTNGVSTTYGYDLNGNRTSKDTGGNTTRHYYDTSDRMTHVRDDDDNVIFTARYDARTRRLSKTEGVTTLFRYDGGTNFQELKNSGSGFTVDKELVRAGGLGGGIGSVLYSDESMRSTPGPVEYFLYNAVGSTTAITDASQNVTQTNLYEANGETVVHTGGSDNNRLRNTKERDATGLDNDGFRYYDSATGRYMSRDPLGYKDGMNVYLSVHDNAVNAVDPLGLSAWETAKSAAWAAVMSDPVFTPLHVYNEASGSVAAGVPVAAAVVIAAERRIPVIGSIVAGTEIYEQTPLGGAGIGQPLGVAGNIGNSLQIGMDVLTLGLMAHGSLSSPASVEPGTPPPLPTSTTAATGSTPPPLPASAAESAASAATGDAISPKMQDIHSRYSDGTPVYEGQQPSKIAGANPEAGGTPHTVIKNDMINNRIYKAREYGEGGRPIRDIDFTGDTFPSGRPRPGANGVAPHQHTYTENVPGNPRGGYKRGSAEEFEEPGIGDEN